MTKQYKGILLVILSAVLFGCMPLMAKTIYENGGTPVGLTLLRNFLALPALWAVSYTHLKRWRNAAPPV